MSVPYVLFESPPLPYLTECGRTLYEPGDKHPDRRNLGVFDLLFVRKGRLYIGEDQEEWSLEPGEMLILRPDRYHYAVKPCDEETLFDWLHMQVAGSWTEAVIDSSRRITEKNNPNVPFSYTLGIPKYWKLPFPEAVYNLLDTLLKASLKPLSEAFWEQQHSFQQLLKLLDARGIDYANAALILAEQTEAYLKTNYQSHISSRILEEALRFHYNYITRCMKQVYGLTPMEYLHHYRLEQAKLLLLKTDWPVAKVAEHVGFDNTPYFTRCFANFEGMPPSQYRKRYTRATTHHANYQK